MNIPELPYWMAELDDGLPRRVVHQDTVRAPCPDCPDGNVWTKNGPTDAECPTCRGTAFVWIAAKEAK